MEKYTDMNKQFINGQWREGTALAVFALSPQKLLTNFYDNNFTYKLISSAAAMLLSIT